MCLMYKNPVMLLIYHHKILVPNKLYAFRLAHTCIHLILITVTCIVVTVITIISSNSPASIIFGNITISFGCSGGGHVTVRLKLQSFHDQFKY